MGNYLSCTLTLSNPNSTSIKIILPNAADIRHISSSSRGGAHRTPAADLMLDFPGHFVANSRSLRIGARFHPLSADEELEPGNVYVMIPMARVNSTVNAHDLAPLILAAGKAVRRASAGMARVIPEAPQSPEAHQQQQLKVEVEEDEEVVEFRNRLSLCRSRRPKLETIIEETCACS